MVNRLRRVLHLVEGNPDFEAAYAAALQSQEPPATSHWVLCEKGPRPGLDVPANLEWICVPPFFGGPHPLAGETSPLLAYLSRLLDSFSPQEVVAHPRFASAWESRRNEITELVNRRSSVVWSESLPPAGSTTVDARPVRKESA